MKNVLFIHSSSELYGSDRSLLNIIKYINKKEFKVFVILPCDGPLVYELRKIENVNVEIFEIAILRRKNLSINGGIQYIKSFYHSYRFLKKYIKNNNINIVDTNTSVVFPGAIAAKHLGCKSVWHIREIIKNSLENRVISFMMQRYSDVIVANSYATGKSLRVNSEKIRIVYNAIEEKIINDKIINDKIIELGKDFIVGMAGRINRWKGQKLFVDAAEIVHKSHPNVIFKIAGDAYRGEEHLNSELKEYIIKKNLINSIELMGQVEDMNSFYQSLDIFVLPSIQPEPFGLVIIEAMEHKLPVIATNHGGPKEIITDGKNGFLVEFNNCYEMASRIIELIEDNSLREKISLSGFEKKREMFSVDKMVKEIENVFNENNK